MVYSNLGEGANDHIGIFLYLYDHKSMSLMPLIRPLHSSPLVIPDVTTQFIINAIKTQHKYLIRSFKKVLYVDDSLREKKSHLSIQSELLYCAIIITNPSIRP